MATQTGRSEQERVEVVTLTSGSGPAAYRRDRDKLPSRLACSEGRAYRRQTQASVRLDHIGVANLFARASSAPPPPERNDQTGRVGAPPPPTSMRAG